MNSDKGKGRGAAEEYSSEKVMTYVRDHVCSSWIHFNWGKVAGNRHPIWFPPVEVQGRVRKRTKKECQEALKTVNDGTDYFTTEALVVTFFRSNQSWLDRCSVSDG